MNTTATCGGNRECELAQWSKLCEVNNEQTILGTTRGQGPFLDIVVVVCKYISGEKVIKKAKFGRNGGG